MTNLIRAAGDLTAMDVDVIVNAANRWLRGGGGLDGAVHRRAGRDLLVALEKQYPEGGHTGHVYQTAGYQCPAEWIFHAIGPDYREENQRDPALLRSCYLEALALADAYGCETIAFPLISAGIYGWPIEEAADIAVSTIASFESDTLRTAYLVVLEHEDVNRDAVNKAYAEHVEK